MAGLSLSLVLVVALLTWRLVSGGDTTTYRVPPRVSSAPPQVEPDAAAALLQRLERAVQRGDRDAAVALASPDDTSTAEQLGGLVDNASAARITGVTLRYIDETGGPADDGSWPAAVAVTWRYAGFDEAAARTEVAMRFRATSPGAVIVGIGAADLRTPVWMSGPAQVQRTRTTLVLVVGDEQSSAASYDRLAAAAVPVVARVLPDWKPRLVVEVPADETALERALGVESGYYGQIAAVTGSADGSTAPGSPVHVYVNPDVFDGLGSQGQSVVLDHEAAHVAGDGPRSQAPTWLVEGFADYVALRDTTLPLSKTAAQISTVVRRQGLPEALPGPADFDTRETHLGAIYESAWLICVTLADRGGQAALTTLYAGVSAGEPLDQALRAGFDWSEADLVRAWQDRLSDVARDPA